MATRTIDFRRLAAAASLASIFCVVGACGKVPALRTVIDPDLTPPLLRTVEVPDRRSIAISFSEPAVLENGSLVIEPPLPLEDVAYDGASMLLSVAEQSAGAEYQLKAVVTDERGNGLGMTARFHGHNGEVPALLITELTTRGTRTRPDRIELVALSAGDLGGVTLYDGTPGNYRHRLVFPSIAVEPGDFIVVHCVSTGDPAEVDETASMTESAHPQASEDAWDLWLPEGEGLSGNNGVVSLYARPDGDVLDGVIYSDRTSESDERYRGFGTRRVLERVDELVAAGGWQVAGELARPEDAVDSNDTTSTRSMARGSDHADTDSRADWHITPTRGATFGGLNTDEVFSRD